MPTMENKWDNTARQVNSSGGKKSRSGHHKTSDVLIVMKEEPLTFLAQDNRTTSRSNFALRFNNPYIYKDVIKEVKAIGYMTIDQETGKPTGVIKKLSP